MVFFRIEPHPQLKRLIECYWVVTDSSRIVNAQKIIPDGFTEIIFHFEDPYRTDISGTWCTQSQSLLAGQLKRYFHLENTGISGMVAVKFKPLALAQLFGLDMSRLTGKIVDLESLNFPALARLKNVALPFTGEAELKAKFDRFFLDYQQFPVNPVEIAMDLIFTSNGRIAVSDLARIAGINERRLERLFKKQVGLSPKYYGRIIRFNYIFQLVRLGEVPWNEIVYRAGYYDQSHFIRDFKAFTGEDPSAYYFEKEDLANFFLKK